MPGPHPHPPPRHLASAGDGAAKAVKLTAAAVAKTSAVLFMVDAFPVFPELPTRELNDGFKRRSHTDRYLRRVGFSLRMPAFDDGRANIAPGKPRQQRSQR